MILLEVFGIQAGGLLGRMRSFLLEGQSLEAGGIVRRRSASTSRAVGVVLAGRESIGDGVGAVHVEGSSGFSIT